MIQNENEFGLSGESRVDCLPVKLRILLDSHRQLVGKIEAVGLLKRVLVRRQNRFRSY